MSLPACGCWRAVERLSVRDWDGDYAVYNPLSGNTHLLDIVTGEALAALVAAPRDGAALCAHLAGFLDVPNDAQLAQTTDRVLRVLDELGLIEPADPC